MGVLSNSRELKEDVLFRGSEPASGSKFDAAVIRYLNRVYRSLATGASEFLPEYIEDWWWLRARGVLNIEPVYSTGTVSVINGSSSIIFTPAPASSLTGRRLSIESQPDIPLILSHTAGVTSALLDLPWSGETVAATFRAMKVEYSLLAAVQAIISPMITFQDPERIIGISPEKMDELYPLSRLTYAVPRAFSLESENAVRFSHGGSNDGETIRAEYWYRPKVDDLIDSTSSIPLVPTQWMHVLTDMALTYLLMDKNDDRSNSVALAARTGLAAMLKENRRRNVKIDPLAGKIRPRQDQLL